MYTSTVFFRSLSAVLLVLATASGVSAVCGSNAIGLANAQANAIIVTSDCNAIDSKAIGDHNVCGLYEDGSQVICRDPSSVPSTVHTADGRDWGDCVSSTELCGVEGTSERPIIEWCCTEL